MVQQPLVTHTGAAIGVLQVLNCCSCAGTAAALSLHAAVGLYADAQHTPCTEWGRTAAAGGQMPGHCLGVVCQTLPVLR